MEGGRVTTLSGRERRLAAIHEAGHYVVAEEVGIPVRSPKLRSDGSASVTVNLSTRIGAHGHEERWPLLVVMVAGGIAEGLAQGRGPVGQRKSYSDDDKDLIVELAMEWAEEADGGRETLVPAIEKAEAQARGILGHNWLRVQKTAKRFLEQWEEEARKRARLGIVGNGKG